MGHDRRGNERTDCRRWRGNERRIFHRTRGKENAAAREGSQLGYARGWDIWQLWKNSNLFYQTVGEGILLVLQNFEDDNLFYQTVGDATE
jgi:hypothetical protein